MSPVLDRRDPDYRENVENRRSQVLDDYREGRIGKWTLRALLLGTGMMPREVEAEIALSPGPQRIAS